MKWAIPFTPHSDTCFTGYKNSCLIQHSYAFISNGDEKKKIYDGWISNDHHYFHIPLLFG